MSSAGVATRKAPSKQVASFIRIIKEQGVEHTIELFKEALRTAPYIPDRAAAVRYADALDSVPRPAR